MIALIVVVVVIMIIVTITISETGLNTIEQDYPRNNNIGVVKMEELKEGVNLYDKHGTKKAEVLEVEGDLVTYIWNPCDTKAWHLDISSKIEAFGLIKDFSLFFENDEIIKKILERKALIEVKKEKFSDRVVQIDDNDMDRIRLSTASRFPGRSW